MDISAKYLAFHGAIVLLFGLVSGFPYGVAIVRKKDEEIIRAWKLAHGALTLGGTLSLALAACLAFLNFDGTVQCVVSLGYIVSGYSFCIALYLEPFWKVRGLKWTQNPLYKTKNNIVFVCNAMGAYTSLVGTIALIYGIWTIL